MASLVEILSSLGQPRMAPRSITIPGSCVFPVPPKKALQLKQNPVSCLSYLSSLPVPRHVAFFLPPIKAVQQILIPIASVCFEISGLHSKHISLGKLSKLVDQQTLFVTTHAYPDTLQHLLLTFFHALPKMVLQRKAIPEIRACFLNRQWIYDHVCFLSLPGI
jgi:hypothetical protein